MIPYKFPREIRQQMVERLQAYFAEEREAEMSTMAAEFLLDFILKEIGPHVYNQGIADARRLVEEKLLSIEEDFYALERLIEPSDRRKAGGQNN